LKNRFEGEGARERETCVVTGDCDCDRVRGRNCSWGNLRVMYKVYALWPQPNIIIIIIIIIINKEKVFCL
jgi:hypothetical protein